MYLNLEAEIIRRKIPKNDIANFIGKSYTTFIFKLSGKSNFTYEEALKIQEKFFPDMDIKYLFQKHVNEEKKGA